MQFYPADAPVPEGLRTEDLVLRPLATTDNALDYDAVMATQETLRLRGSGAWPRADFTIEENLADLEEHEADFRARRGFTYTVLKPARARCLGCVYIYPLGDGMDRQSAVREADRTGMGYEAAVWFWVRPDGVAGDLEQRLLATLRTWLRDDFAFGRVVFTACAADVRQMALLREAGLSLSSPGSAGGTQALHFE